MGPFGPRWAQNHAHQLVKPMSIQCYLLGTITYFQMKNSSKMAVTLLYVYFAVQVFTSNLFHGWIPHIFSSTSLHLWAADMAYLGQLAMPIIKQNRYRVNVLITHQITWAVDISYLGQWPQKSLNRKEFKLSPDVICIPAFWVKLSPV